MTDWQWKTDLDDPTCAVAGCSGEEYGRLGFRPLCEEHWNDTVERLRPSPETFADTVAFAVEAAARRIESAMRESRPPPQVLPATTPAHVVLAQLEWVEVLPVLAWVVDGNLLAPMVLEEGRAVRFDPGEDVVSTWRIVHGETVPLAELAAELRSVAWREMRLAVRHARSLGAALRGPDGADVTGSVFDPPEGSEWDVPDEAHEAVMEVEGLVLATAAAESGVATMLAPSARRALPPEERARLAA